MTTDNRAIPDSNCSATDMDAIHAEALEMNKRFGDLYYRYWRWWHVLDEYSRAEDLALAHKQALVMNALI
ncbi:hypothetical protein PT300_11785 [Enterobacteriaceae bacterium ESL0689]|nr:hypothetical protein [Enterobacteriaceae bacterium ESL0689]